MLSVAHTDARVTEGESMTGIMPLDDVRVLDLTRYTAGPYCTRILSDYGADIIKIEQPGTGDPARMMPPFYQDEPGLERSGLFLSLNTNKRSVELDIKTDRGRELFLELVKTADIVVENFKPGTMARLGLSYETLSEANPRVILTSLSNFGQTGPYRDWLGNDLTIYAMGGAMIAAGDAEHEPVKTAGRMTGYQAGYSAALAASVALLGSEVRGTGEWLDISIYETATHSIDLRLGRLLGYQHTGYVATRPSRSSGVATGTYPTSDGYVLITGGVPFLPAVMKMIGREDLMEQPEWADAAARAHVDRIAEFDAYLLPWTLERTMAEVRQAGEDAGVLVGPYNTIADLLEDENFKQRGFFTEIDHPVTGPIKYSNYQFTLHRPDGEPMPARTHAPLLGQHTDEVLGELGLDAAALAALREERVTAGGDDD